MRFLLIVLSALMGAAITPQAGHAHFPEGAKVRSIVLTRDGDGLAAFVRAPAPLLFADLIAEARRDGTPLDCERDVMPEPDRPTCTGMPTAVALPGWKGALQAWVDIIFP